MTKQPDQRKLDEFKLRLMQASDIASVAHVHHESLSKTFGEILPAYAAARTLADFEVAWRERFEKAESQVIILANDEEVLGFGSAGRSRDDDARAYAGEIGRLYLHPSVWGMKLGDRVMQWCESYIGELGLTVAKLWVFEMNTRACRFYQRMGYQTDGASKLAYEANLLRYSKNLAS